MKEQFFQWRKLFVTTHHCDELNFINSKKLVATDSSKKEKIDIKSFLKAFKSFAEGWRYKKR